MTALYSHCVAEICVLTLQLMEGLRSCLVSHEPWDIPCQSYAFGPLQDDWYRRAQLAVEKGDDELAKEALKRRKSNQENADVMKAQLDQQRKAVEQLISNTKCASFLLLSCAVGVNHGLDTCSRTGDAMSTLCSLLQCHTPYTSHSMGICMGIQHKLRS